FVRDIRPPSLLHPAFKPITAAATCDIDGKDAWLRPTLFDARSKSHGFVTSTEPAPIKKASHDALASGHGKNAGSRSLTVHLAFLVQALFLTSAPFFDAPHIQAESSSDNMRHRRQGCIAPSNAFLTQGASHGLVTSTEPAPIKKASQDALASGHGENAGSRSLTMRVVFFVQALFVTSAPFFDAPAFKPIPAAATCDIAGKDAWLRPNAF
ncbi:hypothetical protein MRX96_050592, partial [Rhipicephalus microplus]